MTIGMLFVVLSAWPGAFQEAGPASAAAAAERVELAIDLEPGRQLQFEWVQEVTAAMEAPMDAVGGESSSERITSRIVCRSLFSLRAGAAHPEGEGQSMVLRFGHVEGEVSDGLTPPVAFDSREAPEDMPLLAHMLASMVLMRAGVFLGFTVEPDGTVTDLEGWEESRILAGDDRPQGLYEPSSAEIRDSWVQPFFIPLPGKPVTVGDRWTVRRSFTAGGIWVAVFDFEHELVEVDDESCVVEFTGNLVEMREAEGAERTSSPAMAFMLERGRVDGHTIIARMRLSRRDGLPLRLELRQRNHTAMDLPSGEGQGVFRETWLLNRIPDDADAP
jgi:hypothetical protein